MYQKLHFCNSIENLKKDLKRKHRLFSTKFDESSSQLIDTLSSKREKLNLTVYFLN
jgi:hypothetical protein